MSKWDACHRKVADQPCRNCGAKPCDPAHVIARSIGGRMKADSVIPLCRRCHDLQHDHKLEILPLLRKEEELEAVDVVGLGRAYALLTRGGE